MGLFDKFKNKMTTTENPVLNNHRNTISPNITVSFEQRGIVPIEARTKGKMPICDGLYPHEVLVLSYASVFCEGDTEFHGFWWYKYGIKDIPSILTSLYKKGFIQRGTISDALNKENLSTIKNELQKRGGKATGKKTDLIKKLVELAPEDELFLICKKRPYALTESGATILKKYEWIPFIHNHNIEDLNIWNLTDMMQNQNPSRYRDVIWSYLNKKSIDHARAGNFGLYRNTRLEMSEFVALEKKNINAFSLLCEVVAYDLSGLSNSFNMQYLPIYAKSFFPYEESNLKMAPGITKKIVHYAEEFGWNETELQSHLLNEIGKYRLPFQLFSTDECVKIVIAEIHEDTESLKRLYSTAKSRFKQQYPSIKL